MCWGSSLTAFTWSVAERAKYIHSYNILFVSWLRERSIYKAKRSFPFLAEQQIDVSERDVGETTRDT